MKIALPSLLTAVALAGSISNQAQRSQTPPDFSGIWVPVTVGPIRDLFNVGRSSIPPDGLTIRQDSRTISISLNLADEVAKGLLTLGVSLDRRAVFDLDGTTSMGAPDTGGAAFSHREAWDGSTLVTTTSANGSSWTIVYARDGQRLRVQADGSTVILERQTTAPQATMFKSPLGPIMFGGPAAPQPSSAELWLVQVGASRLLLELTSDGARLAGSVMTSDGERAPISGRVAGNGLFSVDRVYDAPVTPSGAYAVRDVYTATFASGDSLSGTLRSQIDTVTAGMIYHLNDWTAVRMRLASQGRGRTSAR